MRSHCRNFGLVLYASDNDAKSWTHRKKLTGPRQHPGHIMRLADGRLLLSYGNRLDPKGIDVRLSADEGQTWTDPVRVADFQGDGGYPSSVQLPDGRLLRAAVSHGSGPLGAAGPVGHLRGSTTSGTSTPKCAPCV